jgi:hypothetical protein
MRWRIMHREPAAAHRLTSQRPDMRSHESDFRHAHAKTRVALANHLICRRNRVFAPHRLFAFVLLLARGDRSKELEILLLRHELSILRRKTRRPQLTERDRLLLAALSRVMSRRSWQAFLVTPETLLRWHRRIVARRWTYPHRRPGRPSLEPQVRELILRLARENSDWGYVRIVGELRKLGIAVGDAGAERAPPCRHPTGAGAGRFQLADLLASTRKLNPCLRPVHRRHRLDAGAVRVVLRLDRDAPGRIRRLHEQAEHGLDDPAGTQPADGPR